MFFFDRSHIERPKWFESSEVERQLQDIAHFLTLSAKEQSQTTVPIVWKMPIPAEVRNALINASHKKCAFCEEKKPLLQAYRFRPPAHAEPQNNREERACYLWHAFDWNNFFPICNDCKSEENKSLFPVKGKRSVDKFTMEFIRKAPGYHKTFGADAIELFRSSEILSMTAKQEKPLLIEPGSMESITDYFNAKVSGELIPNGAIEKWESNNPISMSPAEFSIHHFNLNKPSKVKKRGDVLHGYCDRLLKISRDRKWNNDHDELFNFETLEFSGAWFIVLHRLGQKLSDAAGKNKWLKPDFIRKSFEFFHKSGTFVHLEKFLGELTDEDAGVQNIPLTGSAPPDNFIDISNITAAPPQVTQPKEADAGRPVQSSKAALAKIHIRNFKALEAIDLTMPKLEKPDSINLQNFPETASLLTLGENATGKSSILEAVTLALIPDDAFETLVEQQIISARRMLLNPAFMGTLDIDRNKAPKSSIVKVTLEDGAQYELKIQPDRVKKFSRRHRTGDGGFSDGVPAKHSPLVFAYGAHRLFGKVSENDSSVSAVATLFSNDAQTINPEKWMIELYEKDPYELDEVVSALREIIQIDGRFESIDVETDPLKPDRKHCVIKLKRGKIRQTKDGFEEEVYTVPIRLDSVSSGYRVVIALVCDIIYGIIKSTAAKTVAQAKRTPCTVLIDEIEVHLHPRWKMQVIGGLRKALPKATFIMTSHDPLCLRGMQSSEIQVLNRFLNTGTETGSAMNEIVESAPGIENMDQFTIEQLLTSDLFQLFTTDDPGMERALAQMGDAISAESKMEDKDREQTLQKIEKEIRDNLPVGDSEVVRLVQEAVVQYLANRRGLRDVEARKAAKEQILAALNGSLS